MLYALKTAIYSVLNIIQLLIFIYVILSWIPQAKNSKFGYILSMLVEPILTPVRKLLDRIQALRSMPMDLSPIVAFLLISVIQSIIMAF